MADTSTSSNSSSGSSSSSSKPGLMNSPASDWELQLAQYLSQVGDQQRQWAAQEYARAGQVTDAQIHNYLAQAQQASDLAGGMLDRYNGLYAPQADQYAREAGTYASNGRLQHEMGRAESGVAQAGQQAQANAERQLEAYGIQPGDGRSEDLIRANATATATAAVNAGETARRATEQEGTRRKEVAMNYGMQLPGASVNAINSAYQGISGAENSALALANTGVNLTTSASKYYDPAMSLKYPPVGQTSQSTGQQASNGFSTSGGGGSTSGGGSGSGRGAPASPGSGLNGGGYSGGYNPMGGSSPLTSSPGGKTAYVNPTARIDNNVQKESGFDPFKDLEGPDETGLQPPAPPDWGDDPGVGVPPGDQLTGPDETGFQPPSQYDETGGGNYDPWGSSAPDYSQFDQNYNSGNDSYNGYDSSQYQDYGSSDYAYAGGGGVIPSSMSPSGGAQTDDVAAHIPQTGGKAQLNVGEFVIPKDVALWKGQEFFQKMIQQSRKARVGAPAKPSHGRPQ